MILVLAVPCFHSSPHMDEVEAGQTKWTQTYIMFYEGDITKALVRMAATHKLVTKP